jgi:hypothetical protein
MSETNLNNDFAMDIIDRGETIQRAKAALQSFGNIYALGKLLDVDKTALELNLVTGVLATLKKQDDELLSYFGETTPMSDELREAFNELTLVITDQNYALGRQTELIRKILPPFANAIEAYNGTELDILSLDPKTRKPIEGSELREANQEERLLRELIAQAANCCQTTILYVQCQHALAAASATGNTESAVDAIKSAGGDYFLAWASLRLLRIVEPRLTFWSGNALSALGSLGA